MSVLEEPSLRDRLREASVLLPCALATVVLFLVPALAGEMPIRGDVANFALPQFSLIQELLQAGSLPGWNPYMGTGLPLVGDTSLPLYYPTNVLLYVMAPADYLCFFLIFHFLVAQAGTFALGRSLGFGKYGAALAAASFAAGGFAMSHTNTPMYVGGLAWVPWAGWALLRFCRRDLSLKEAVIAAAPTLMIILVGAVEYLALANFAAVVLALSAKLSWKRIALRLALILALVAGIAGVIWLPFLAVLPETARGHGMTIIRAGRFSFHPYELIGVAIPQAFDKGGIPIEKIGITPRVWFESLYFGALPLACLVFAALRAPRERLVWLSAGASIIALAFAAGQFSPVYRGLFDHLPPLQSSRYPAKFFLPVALFLALVAGLGFDRALAEKGNRWFDRLWIGLVSLALIVGMLAMTYRLTDLRNRVILPLVGAIAAWAWLALAPQRQRAAGVMILLALELFVAGWLMLVFGPKQAFEREPLLLPTILAAQTTQPIRVARTFMATQTRMTAIGDQEVEENIMESLARFATLYPNLNVTQKFRTVFSFSPLRSHRWECLYVWTGNPKFSEIQRARALGATHMIFSYGDDKSIGDEIESAVAVGAWRFGRIKNAAPWGAVYANPTVVPDFEAAAKIVLSQAYNPSCMSLVEPDPVSGKAPEIRPAPTGRVGTIQPKILGTDSIEVTIESGVEGLAVIREAYAPGWRAFIHGSKIKGWKEVAIYPVDGQFRGIVVPPGRHTMVMKYRPPGWDLGLFVTVASLVGLVLSALVSLRRRAANQEAEESASSTETTTQD